MFGVEGEEYEGLQLAVFMLNACLTVLAAMDVSNGPDSYCVISPETFKEMRITCDSAPIASSGLTGGVASTPFV